MKSVKRYSASNKRIPFIFLLHFFGQISEILFRLLTEGDDDAISYQIKRFTSLSLQEERIFIKTKILLLSR
ncbi:unnamed protein product [Wuchereria bancrofti]|uniref:Uncharacterized protein n=1 Tax=Wuchereria bancrofti TaxID=6293 RepID=A0A3P7GK39_WUCBA|nr:unnamed protein product [Wuchereria bancrofti]